MLALPFSRRSRSRWRPLGLAVALLMALPQLLLACGSPPQILEITPGRGAIDVPTNAPIRIRFDRPLDQPSVAKRFRLSPAIGGQISWEAHDTLVFRHDTLDPSSKYTVTLAAGYSDRSGDVNGFNHSWTFQTEAPPALRGASPGQDETQVDPATYVALNFSREMNSDSFRGSITFSPSLTFSVESDPADGRRVLVAPKSLLLPQTTYDLTVRADATDADGNHVPELKLRFVTGPVRSLSRWITFVAAGSGAPVGSGVWMVDDAGFPRILEETTVDRFSWSPDGSNLLLRHPDLSWTDYQLGSAPTELPFTADWAAYLGPNDGYAYLTGATLDRYLPGGPVLTIARSVSRAAVSHDLGRIAYTVTSADGVDIRAYDVALRAQYRLERETEPITELAWAPDGTRLAFVASAGAAGELQLRVKSLNGSGAVNTVAIGAISDLAWLSNSSDVTFSALLTSGASQRSHIFRVNTALPPAQLTAANAIGPVSDLDAFLPRPSPDGHQIAFLLGAPESAQIWLMNSDGTGASRLTGFDSQSFPFACRDLHWAAP